MNSFREAQPMSKPQPQPKPLVYVVDDDISVRESLETLIDSAGWLPVTFASAQAFLARPRTHTTSPSCLVLDVSLPDLNGLELQQRIAADHGDIPIIFITGYGDVPMSVRAMKAGAMEFLTKPYGTDALLDALRSALERSRSTMQARERGRAIRLAYSTLTPREREVMAMVVSGLLNKQVGGELGISEITVKTHRGNVMRKMDAESFAELVNMAAELEIGMPTLQERGR